MPEAYRENLIVLDGTTGQNALSQLKEFKEAADVTGIILTKMDGTAKGGIAVAIQAEYGIPVNISVSVSISMICRNSIHRILSMHSLTFRSKSDITVTRIQLSNELTG